VVDAKDLDHDSKELCCLVSVQPIEGLAVLLAELATNPDNYASVKSGSVGNDLTKVTMVGGLELVLNNDDTVTT
jgi:hypothetical protein